MKSNRKKIKEEIVKRLTASITIKGLLEADVTDLWNTSSELLLELFHYCNWEFIRMGGRVIFKEKG